MVWNFRLPSNSLSGPHGNNWYRETFNKECWGEMWVKQIQYHHKHWTGLRSKSRVEQKGLGHIKLSPLRDNKTVKLSSRRASTAHHTHSLTWCFWFGCEMRMLFLPLIVTCESGHSQPTTRMVAVVTRRFHMMIHTSVLFQPPPVACWVWDESDVCPATPVTGQTSLMPWRMTWVAVLPREHCLY